MSATTDRPPGTAAATGAGTGSWVARHRGTLLMTGVVLLAVLVVVVAGGSSRTSEELDPDNPGGSGAQALARVLADEGVAVEVARDAAALDDALAGDTGSTTVLVTSTDHLGVSTTGRLLDSAEGHRLVLTEPPARILEELGLEDPSQTLPVQDPIDAGCTDTGLAPLDGLSLLVESAESYPSPTGCFAGGAGWLLSAAGPDRITLGAGEILHNDQVLRSDNAAVALRLLGQDERLVWYVPSLRDLEGDDGVTLVSLLPPWLVPGVWLAGIAVVGLALWRGRRLGALSTEPLPVTVRAVETTEGRAGLYRRTGDRAHAAAVLRRRARRESARALRLPAPDDPALVREVARHLGRPAAEVERLLAADAPAPTDDAALVHLASELAALETEVRRS